MIKAKDEYSEWKERREILIEGGQSFKRYLGNKYDISPIGLGKVITEWKEQLE